MTTTIKAAYMGDMQVELTHGPTGKTIVTDLPPDNDGKGRTFSPTDLFASSLASCILTIMAKVADRGHIPFEGSYIEIDKIMNEAPRRVGKFVLKVQLNPTMTAVDRKKLLRCIEGCPVHKSLHPDIKLEIK